MFLRLATCLTVALTCFSSVAAAQQPCTTDARQVVNEIYRHMLEREAGAPSQSWVDQSRADASRFETS